MSRCFFLTRATCLTATVVICFLGPVAIAETTYKQHVRPILKAHCFHCHGEAGEIEGSLDLRLRRFILDGGDSGPAIVPGEPEASLLLDRVSTGEMPPGDDKQLSASEIAAIRQWIASGAAVARPEPEQIGSGPLFTQEELEHWAFQPIRRPQPPDVGELASHITTPVDAFILAGLRKLIEDQRSAQDTEESDSPASGRATSEAPTVLAKSEQTTSETPLEHLVGLSPEADRYTLLRRATHDLLGLPPTPEEIAEFLADHAPDAYERMIERLLASPHYGERWGRHWLDVAGYADSEGVTDDDPVRSEAFHYRDYVIRAFNADKPFDQFIREQLAGDEMVPLPHANLAADSIEKLTATGFLRMAPDGTASSSVDQDVARNQVMSDTIQIVSSSLLGLTVGCAECHDHRYDPIPQEDYFRMRAIFEPALDWKNWKVPRARRLSLYTDDQRARAAEIEAAAVAVEEERKRKVEEFIARTLEEQLALLIELSDEERASLRTAYQTAANERTDVQQDLLKRYPVIASISAGSLYLYDGRRLERVRKLEAEFKAKQQAAVQAANQQLAAAESSSSAGRVAITIDNLEEFDPQSAAELEQQRREIEELRAFRSADQLKEYVDRATSIRSEKPPEVFIRVLTEVPGQIPATYRFYRGDYQQPKEEVAPGELRVLEATGTLTSDLTTDDPDLPTSGRRLAFARQLTSGRHPLTARVIVNRIWMHHMGRGLANTPNDFGVLGEPPTHPELLDWLASQWMDHGWSVKDLHRVIMHSATYRQQSQRRSDLDAIDPENRYYGRMSLRRLDAETLRDSMLAVSGQLNQRLFGEPVPVMEDDVGQIVIGKENLDGERKPIVGDDLQGEDRRRSVYVQVRRSRPLAVLETFDAPTMDPNCTHRDASTVPLQSLMLMNNAFVIEQAERLAERIRDEVGGEAGDEMGEGAWREQIARAWQLAFQRPASDDEIERSLEFLERQMVAFREQDSQSSEETLRDRARASFCQALYGMNEFLYVD